jgi:hypothetical protein
MANLLVNFLSPPMSAKPQICNAIHLLPWLSAKASTTSPSSVSFNQPSARNRASSSVIAWPLLSSITFAIVLYRDRPSTVPNNQSVWPRKCQSNVRFSTLPLYPPVMIWSMVIAAVGWPSSPVVWDWRRCWVTVAAPRALRVSQPTPWRARTGSNASERDLLWWMLGINLEWLEEQ